jgi:hypothetical protein
LQQHISRLEASQNQLRGEKRPHSQVDEEEQDLKPDVAGLELMTTQLEEAKTRDGGFVDISQAVQEEADESQEDIAQQQPEGHDEKPVLDDIKPERDEEMASQVEDTYEPAPTSRLPPPPPALDQEEQKPDVADLVARGHQLIASQMQAADTMDAAASNSATLPPFPMEQIEEAAVAAE